MYDMRCTDIQYYIMEVIVNGTDDGVSPDMEQLIETLESRHGYKTTRDNLQFSLRRLQNKYGLIVRKYELRRGKRRTVLKATVDGIKLLIDGPWSK